MYRCSSLLAEFRSLFGGCFLFLFDGILAFGSFAGLFGEFAR